MSKKYTKTLRRFAEQLRLSFDAETLTIFGSFNGYNVLLLPINNSYNFTLKLSVKHKGQMPDSRLIKEVVSESKTIKGSSVKGYQVNYNLNAGLTANRGIEKLQEGLTAITNFLKHHDFGNCCQSSGTQEAEIGIYKVEGTPMFLCEDCFQAHYEESATKDRIQNQKKESLVAGLVGALLGSLIGVIAIVILGQLGYVAAVSGIIMAVCSLKGYELLGGRLSNKGIIGSIILMVIMVYIGNRLDWAIFLSNYYVDVDIPYAFQVMPSLATEGLIDSGEYYGGLTIVYLFTAIGVIPTIIGIARSRKLKNESHKMNF